MEDFEIMRFIKKIMLHLFFVSLGFVFVFISSTEAQNKPKVYTFNFNEIDSLVNLVIPDKYRVFWDDIIRAKKNGKTSEEIIAITKKKHGIGIDDYESVLKNMGIKNRFIAYVMDCMLNKKPVMQMLFKGALTPPKGTAQYDDVIEAVLPGVDRILKKYKDKFRFKTVIYAGGILGDEPDYIRKIKLDEIQWAGGTISLAEMVEPAISVYDLPFLFDYEPELYYDKHENCQIDWILDKSAPTINRLLDKKGFILMALADGGSWECIATKRAPILKAEDLSKYTFFMFPQSRIAGEINKALNFKKTLVCKIWDVPSVAATGMLDSLVCCWYWHIIVQVTPYYKYVTDYPIRGFLAACGIVQKKMLYDMVNLGKNFGPMMGMDKDEMLRIARNMLFSFTDGVKGVLRRNLRVKEGEARRRLIESGIYKMVKLPEAELNKIRNKILPLYSKLADQNGMYPKWFLDEVLKYREEYRKFKKDGKLTKKWYKKCIYPDGFDPYKWTRVWNIK